MNLAGRVLGGRFELISPLGEGGYGAVYLARQISMDRQVAVKVIHPRVAQGGDFVDRFEREARVASRLQHPNTVVYFDFGRDEDIHFLAMEFVKGKTLGAVVTDEGPLTAARTIHMAHQICGALGEAHRFGLVHRDLKPANILLTRRGGDPDFIKVIDFGLAKIVQGDTDATNQDLTSEGVLLGTPAYMSPEQIRGHELDHRCDIYALGVILFVMLTGKRPFDGDTPLGTAVMHLTEPVPLLREHNPSLPADLERLVWLCMAKERGQRPPSVEAIATELDGIFGRLGPTTSGSLYENMAEATGGMRQTAISADVYAPPPTATLDATPSGQSGERLGAAVGAAEPDAGTLRYGEASGPSSRAPGLSKGLVGLLTVLLLASAALAVVLMRGLGQRGGDASETELAGVEPLPRSRPVSPPEAPNVEPEAALGEPTAEGAGSVGLGELVVRARQELVDGVVQAGQHLVGAPGPELADSRGTVATETVTREEETGDRSEPVDGPRSAGGVETEESTDGEQRTEPQGDEGRRASSSRRSGRLRINAVPYGVVYCNGEDYGPTPVEAVVRPGRFDCRVVSPQGQEVRRRIEVEPGAGDLITIRFDR